MSVRGRRKKRKEAFDKVMLFCKRFGGVLYQSRSSPYFVYCDVFGLASTDEIANILMSFLKEDVIKNIENMIDRFSGLFKIRLILKGKGSFYATFKSRSEIRLEYQTRRLYKITKNRIEYIYRNGIADSTTIEFQTIRGRAYASFYKRRLYGAATVCTDLNTYYLYKEKLKNILNGMVTLADKLLTNPRKLVKIKHKEDNDISQK